ncbi:hypothetical protein ABZW30_43555 [Kitasatospora sp. NPDC004669]|uniref:hypothetical protein n=1 Tax=Kitasatospora sp. NPDC004669 TaxID=3154555 RepID=UPI0033B87364
MLVELLDSVPGLRRSDLGCYEAEDGLDRLDLSLIACNEAGNYAVHKGKVPERINMVELICSSGSPQAYESALALAVRIADTLGWEVADPDTDEVLHARPTG